MKKIFTLLALGAGISFSATAQRNVDLAILLNGPTPSTLNCTDSVAFEYSVVNLGPANLIPGDTLFVQDPEITASNFSYIFELTTGISAGDTAILYGGNTTLSNINVLYKTDFSDTVAKPFANGNAAFAVILNSVGSLSGDLIENNDTNNVAASLVNVACGGTGIGNIAGLEKSSLSVYPNPASAVLNFKYNFTAASSATARVMDQLGREVLMQNFGKQYAGERNFSINTSGLTSGMYTIELVMDNNRAISKFTVK